MYPSSYTRKDFAMVKSYEAHPLPEFTSSDVIITLVNPKSKKGYHPTDHIIKQWPYSDFPRFLQEDPGHNAEIGSVYPFSDPSRRGPLILVVCAFIRWGKRTNDQNLQFLKKLEPDDTEDRANYMKAALDSIIEMDNEARLKLFANIERAYLYGSNHAPQPYHPEEPYGSVFVNWCLIMGLEPKIIIHPQGDEYHPKVLGEEIKNASPTSASNPFSPLKPIVKKKLQSIASRQPQPSSSNEKAKRPPPPEEKKSQNVGVKRPIVSLELMDDDDFQILPSTTPPASPQLNLPPPSHSTPSKRPRNSPLLRRELESTPLKKEMLRGAKGNGTPPKVNGGKSIKMMQDSGASASTSSQSYESQTSDSQNYENYSQSFNSQAY